MSTLSKITDSGKALWIVLIVLGSLSVLIASIILLVQLNGINNRNGMQDYLRDKYGQEFTVRDIKVRSAGFGVPGQFAGKATPKNDRTLVFEVGKSRSEGGNYFDSYTGAVWAREERPRVEAFLKTIYGEDVPQFDLITHIPTAEEPDPIRGKVPSIDEAMKKYRDNFAYSIGIDMTIKSEFSQSELDDNNLKIRKIVNFLLTKDVSSQGVRYSVNIQSQDAGYRCNLYREQLHDEAKIDSCLIKVKGKTW